MQSAAARLAALARRQHGVFTRTQALECGMSATTIRRRIRSGTWLRAHAGVYLERAVPASTEQAALAACLACGPAAFASHLTAGRLLGLELAPDPIDVTVPRWSHLRPRGVRVHRSGETAGIARAGVIPITNGVRTIAELASVLDDRTLEIALDTLWRRRSLDPESVDRYLAARTPPGCARLRAFVRERLRQRPPGSDLETIYVQILRSFGVPLPVRQHHVRTRSGSRFIDLCYPDARVAIELDGFATHGLDRSVFDDDHIRRNDLDALGWKIRSYSKAQCVSDPVYVATSTAEAVGLEPVRWRPRR